MFVVISPPNAGPIYVLHVSADGLAPSGARPSAGTVLIKILCLLLSPPCSKISVIFLSTKWHNPKEHSHTTFHHLKFWQQIFLYYPKNICILSNIILPLSSFMHCIVNDHPEFFENTRKHSSIQSVSHHYQPSFSQQTWVVCLGWAELDCYTVLAWWL